jgi:serine/threonine-protein kinase
VRRFLRIAVYALFLFGLGIVAGHFTVQLLGYSRTVAVPDLKGKGVRDANDLLRGEGLYMRVKGEDYDSLVPEGAIMRQDEPAGSKVKQGREIGVVLSKGPRVRYVPEVVGQTFEEAESLLRSRGIRIGKVLYVHSERIPKGQVVAQRPEPNERGSDSLSMIVSLGDFEP